MLKDFFLIKSWKIYLHQSFMWRQGQWGAKRRTGPDVKLNVIGVVITNGLPLNKWTQWSLKFIEYFLLDQIIMQSHININIDYYLQDGGLRAAILYIQHSTTQKFESTGTILNQWRKHNVHKITISSLM